MNPKRMLIIGSMAAAITAGSGVAAPAAEAGALDSGLRMKAPAAIVRTAGIARKDSLQQALGVSSDEQLYEEIYEGRSLAEIADRHLGDAEQVIDLQVSELQDQLRTRLESGSLLLEHYYAQLAELEAIVTRSVYGEALK
ncbi:hypothetical protein [Gorillibacterium timonense]|uniref:hypothetical protein n=1 Tax=Gorillibacterium timonense TaxID=1689269 RepID=UPI00071C53F1|nr:hypothetical protein [Gorillibacterium timonense]